MKAKFDTRVQELKYLVLREVAKGLWDENLEEHLLDIPKTIVPGPKPTMRCCIYKERAIVEERIKIALGGNKNINNVVEVIKIACDECKLGGYEVSNRCRGCIAHRCQGACRKNAITFDEKTHVATINKDLCVNCGMCAKACPYQAITNYVRPCEQACKVKAISKGPDNAANIDDEKCVQCGACVYQCPFGSIVDKSYIKDCIKLIKDSDFSRKYPVYAVVAPSIASQCSTATLGQVVSGIKELGFFNVVEAALGADMVAYAESQELAEKGRLTSSCCPTFVRFIEKTFPTLKDKISHNLSPMATISKWLKEQNPECKVVFIGPCISKKAEILRDEVKGIVDLTLTFEELQALIDSRNIDLTTLEEHPLDNASYYGRIFARTHGLSDAVAEALKEQGSDFVVKPLAVDGLDNCRTALTKFKAGSEDFNFIEGMGCVNGCIGGPACLTHEIRDRAQVDAYGNLAKEKTIKDAIDVLSNK